MIIQKKDGAFLYATSDLATLEYRFENRPDSRDLNTLYFAYKRDFANGVLDVSLRLPANGIEPIRFFCEQFYRPSMQAVLKSSFFGRRTFRMLRLHAKHKLNRMKRSALRSG